MKQKWKSLIIILSVVAVTFFYCEFLNYYVVIGQCSWPEFRADENHKNLIKALLLADPHLLGPYKGHWFDKLRREWQMHRAFQTAVSLFQPDFVFMLGDLFDEGEWCNQLQYDEYIRRFFSLFSIPKTVKMYVVPGNHDVGFHYAIHPYLLHQFEKFSNSSSVQFLNAKENYFVLINSMAMEGDGCYMCSRAEKKLEQIAAYLRCIKRGKCNNKNNTRKYSRPIVLQHFPMHRMSDSECNEKDNAPPEIKNKLFHEKWDCLSEKASEKLYDQLNPRLIFTGHVHHGCHTVHREDIHEYTLSSFSWRNKNNPTFMLAKITPEDYALEKCDLPRETTVIFLYISASLGIILMHPQLCHFGPGHDFFKFTDEDQKQTDQHKYLDHTDSSGRRSGNH